MDDYMINRTDSHGRSIYLQDRPATASTVIFTGAPGMGKSYALGRAADAARSNGDLVLSVDAGSREPLQDRLARAINDQYNELGGDGGGRVLRDLGRMVDKMLGDRAGVAEKTLAALAPVLQRAISRLRGADKPTITDLTDRLGDLAGQQQKRVLLVIDNLDTARQQDIDAISQLADHLAPGAQPVQLAVGATGPAVDALLNAASPDGAEQPSDRFDVRECTPIPDDELKPALIASLHRQGAAVQADGVSSLVEEANGAPGRLLRLADHAASLATPTRSVDRATADEAIQNQREADQWAHRATWSGLSDEARIVVARTAAQPRGVTLDQLPAPADDRAWVERGRRVAELVDSGVLRRDDDRLTIADPGLRQWVQTNTTPLPAAGRSGSATKVKRATTRSTSTTRSTASKSPTRQTKSARTEKSARTTKAARAGTAATARTRRTRQTSGVGRG